MPRWIVYGALGIWISGALLDLVIASMRVLYSTLGYGRPIRPTWSYFLSGIGSLFGYGGLAWLFYSNYIGELSALIIGGLLAIPEVAYLFLWTQSSPKSPLDHDTSTSDS